MDRCLQRIPFGFLHLVPVLSCPATVRTDSLLATIGCHALYVHAVRTGHLLAHSTRTQRTPTHHLSPTEPRKRKKNELIR
ncbi:hypothetical protein LZ554_003517 [Drepanopeziza brunnea f. sp. 'monogermtubi']|nr:hypothetical protein LZ554_003517 [Drepanopeziza brunnea f. sp. 'monogermtubi']